MSYPRDLDEISEDEIRAELRRREKDRFAGLCDYCQRPVSSDPCQFPLRHHHRQEKPQPSEVVLRLVRLFQERPTLYAEVLQLMRTPLMTCEGHRGPCDQPVLWPTGAMTHYTWDGQGENPNQDPLLCPACSDKYVEDWQERWDEYRRSVLP